MILIPTTATLLEKLQKQAKDIKKDNNLKYQQALEFVAREAGYDSWGHAQWCYKQKNCTDKAEQEGLTPQYRGVMDYYASKAKGAVIERLQVKGDLFHGVEIDGMYFFASIGPDITVVRKSGKKPSDYEMGWVQLGHAALITRDAHNNNWAVCKYSGTEPRIKLGDMSFAAIHAVAYEFGIGIRYNQDDLRDPELQSLRPFNTGDFYKSPAFQSLREYAVIHPKKIKKYSIGSYLGDWSNAAASKADEL